MASVVVLLLVATVIGSDTGCRGVNNCDGPAMICMITMGGVRV